MRTNTDEFPPGVSGSPVVDHRIGAVSGMNSHQRRLPAEFGGAAVTMSALRQFAPVCQSVLAAHDLWHGRRPLMTDDLNWIDLQQEMTLASMTADGGGHWDPTIGVRPWPCSPPSRPRRTPGWSRTS
ncbi:hypothetical protein [Streptomyces sp. NPDC002054]|uniref:hypothetical protein n=1 Tax=Streptomyces sp. NPDC002054 TaxID=3154663 RepID=UPI00332B564C